MPTDRLATVLTSMHISIASPRLPCPYKAGRMSLYELVKSLRNVPVGAWLSVNLAVLQGSTPSAKQSPTVRTTRRQFNAIQTQAHGSLYGACLIQNPRPGGPENSSSEPVPSVD
jgi:hypothetical protein